MNNSVQIHLTEPSRSNAAAALFPIPSASFRGLDYEETLVAAQAHQDKYADQIQARQDFTGPDFKGCVKNARLENGSITVTLDDDTVYIYPEHSYSRIKAYSITL